MGVQLNIKDTETVRLARQLADVMGQPISKAIKAAIERELQHREDEFQAKLAEVRAISADFRKAMPAEWAGKSSTEIMNELYDDHGLPR